MVCVLSGLNILDTGFTNFYAESKAHIADIANEGDSNMAYDDDNIFAKILRGEIPCEKVMENDHVLAFNDISPQAPIHILVIPKGSYTDIQDFGANASPDEISEFWRAVSSISTDLGLHESGFRVIANTGMNGGQEVPHFHAHILGGKALGAMLPEAA